MTVKWNGSEVIKAIKKVSRDNVQRAVFLVQKDATLDVNVDTGRHRASISGAVSFSRLSNQIAEVKSFTSSKTGRSQMSTAKDLVEKPKAERGEFIGVVGSNVEYAVYREIAKPSLRNALAINESKIKAMFNGALK